MPAKATHAASGTLGPTIAAMRHSACSVNNPPLFHSHGTMFSSRATGILWNLRIEGLRPAHMELLQNYGRLKARATPAGHSILPHKQQHNVHNIGLAPCADLVPWPPPSLDFSEVGRTD